MLPTLSRFYPAVPAAWPAAGRGKPKAAAPGPSELARAGARGSTGVPSLGPMSLPLDGSSSQWELLRKTIAWPSSTSHLTKPKGGDSHAEHPSGQASLPPSCESGAACSPWVSPVPWRPPGSHHGAWEPSGCPELLSPQRAMSKPRVAQVPLRAQTLLPPCSPQRSSLSCSAHASF